MRAFVHGGFPRIPGGSRALRASGTGTTPTTGSPALDELWMVPLSNVPVMHIEPCLARRGLGAGSQGGVCTLGTK